MKVNIGRQVTGKKYPHKFAKRVYTTGSAGFMQPTFCRELIAQDTISFRPANQVRLNPTQKPTFGRLSVRNYMNFVPFETIWHPFASFLNGKPYQGVFNSYIPTTVPSAPLSFWMFLLIFCGRWTCIYVDPSTNAARYFYSDSLLHTIKSHLHDTFSAFAGMNLNSTKTGLAFDFAQQIGLFSIVSNNPDPTSENLQSTLNQSDLILPFVHENVLYYLCVRLSDRGRNLRKILLGCGYKIISSFRPLSVLPVFGYYKTWFDLMAVQRTATWKDTNAFSCMEILEQTGMEFMDSFTDPDEGSDFFVRFLNFFWNDLANCFYTSNPDFAAAHIVGTGINPAMSVDTMSPGYAGDYEYPDTVQAAANNQPQLSPDTPISQDRLNILQALYKRVNIATAVGGRIKELMRSIFGSDYMQEEESNFVGATSNFIDIEPVMSTAETDLADIGDFAGRGFGHDPSQFYEFTARVPGLFYCLSTIVPEAALAQGIDPCLHHVKPFDYFNGAFDAITLLPSHKMDIYGVEDYHDQPQYDSGFGNIPNYTEYKVERDNLNGDMSLPSTRQSYLPYTLAKLLPWTDKSVDSDLKITFHNVNPNIITAGEIWRYIGKDKWLGNFDRIFTNSGNFDEANAATTGTQYDDVAQRVDDNYIMYFNFDYTIQSHALPLTDSWQTDPFASAGHDTIEKA